MSFSLGEKVLFLHETGTGKVIEVLPGGFYMIEDEDGFKKKYNAGEICKLHTKKLSKDELPELPIESLSKSSRKPLNSNIGIPEIDLHIEQLLDSTLNMSNHEIVQYQMKVLRHFMEDAMQKKYRKVLVIHGVGQGVLRREVHLYLRGMDGAICHNEHYTPNGFGATLVELKYTY